jgi:hypothetical protein
VNSSPLFHAGRLCSSELSADSRDRRLSALFPAELVFFIQCLLQLFPGLVVEFVVLARGLASLLPELVSPPDNIHFFGCGHAFSLKRRPALGGLRTEARPR